MFYTCYNYLNFSVVGKKGAHQVTVARWPNFWAKNNSKHAPDKYFLAGKTWWPENGRIGPKLAEKSFKSNP
jgi:hypothetical protein